MNIGIIGLGLMGGSIAKALNKHHRIVALDINPDAINDAIHQNIISWGTSSVAEYAKSTDVSFVCLYPAQIPGFINDNQSYFHSGHRFIEIAGVKKSLFRQINPLLRKDLEIIYTHPIAGREKKGIAHADETIFRNANFVICPVDGNKEKSLILAESLASEMGFKNITRLTLEEHDEIIAYTSQLTHVISLALVGSDDNHTETGKYIGDSYRDLTRIAMINEDLWADLFAQNKENLLSKIDRFSLELAKYRKNIAENNTTELKKSMMKVREKRLSMEKGGHK